MPFFNRFSLSSFILGSAFMMIASTETISATPADDINRITRQSQEFSDASASGNAEILARDLDDDVVFMEESGAIDSKKDIVSSAQPSPDGITNRLIQSDLTIKLHGDIAVTSFTDTATTNIYGQLSKSRFRSVEVWLREHGSWRMISSETLALPEDPPSIALPPASLDQYAGTYHAGPKLKVKVEHRDGKLTSATNDAKPLPMLAEAPDVLFTPGQPRLRRIFERDASGKIVGFKSRRDGHDVLDFKRES